MSGGMDGHPANQDCSPVSEDKTLDVKNASNLDSEVASNYGNTYIANEMKIRNVTNNCYVTNNCQGAFAPQEAEKVFTHLPSFLREILPRFVTDVEPVESGLVEALRKTGILTDQQEQDITAEHKSEKRARRLWSLLNKVSPRLFAECCMPALSTAVPGVFEGATFAYTLDDQECLRHFVMTRLEAERFADILVAEEACSLDQYMQISESQLADDAKWDIIFCLCKQFNAKDNTDDRRCDAGDPMDRLGQLLQLGFRRAKQAVPENFPTLLAGGLQCKQRPSCPPAVREKSRKRRQRHVSATCSAKGKCTDSAVFRECGTAARPSVSACNDESGAVAASSSSDYPPSSSSDEDWCGGGETPPSSPNNSGSEDAEERSRETQSSVASYHDIETAVMMMDALGKGIVDASVVKTTWLQLQNVQKSISLLACPAVTSLSTAQYAFKGRSINKDVEAKDLYNKLKVHYERASKIAGNTKSLLGKMSGMAGSQVEILREQYFVLENELNEGCACYRKAEALMDDVAD